MAFVDGDSFDTYNGTGGAGASSVGLAIAWTLSGASSLIAGRFGGQAWRGSEGAGTFDVITRTLDSNVGPNFAIHFAVRLSTVTSGGTICYLRFTGTSQIDIAVNTLGGLVVSNAAGTLITTPNNVLIANSWHSVEIRCFIDNAGTVEIAVDGVSQGSASGDTLIAGTAAINQVLFAAGNIAGSGSTWDFDDYMLGNSYAFFTPSRAEVLNPNADTATKQWTPSTGIVNYQMVDELLCNADVDYVVADTVGLKDLYDVPSLSIIPAAIHAVQLVAYARTTDAQARSISLNVDVAGLSNGPNLSLSSTYNQKRRAMAVNPITAIAWQYADITAMKIGQELTV
jgi:hypothetical protein